MQEIAPGVVRVATSFVNAYLLGEPDGNWALVDTGLPGFAPKIIAAAEARFGARSRPTAIFLTHGHFDHAGSARALSNHWGVPVYAHRLEMPYLTGRSDYPPPDPTVGGAIAMLSRVLPHGGYDLGARMRVLPTDPNLLNAGAGNSRTEAGGELPGLPGWRWVFTPGHSPGHVAFYRPADRVLLAGDALATVNMNSYVDLLVTNRREIGAGGPPFICDWAAYGQSVARLAELTPTVLACGHGLPLAGGGLAGDLERYAKTFAAPPHGRYVREPAHTDERGVDWLPPKPSDPFPYLVGAAAVGLVAALALLPGKRGR